MSAEIRRTTVTPTEGGSVVQLHISDAPLEAPFEAIELQMTVSLPRYEKAILVEQAQREAMKRAQDVLSSLLQQLAAALNERGFSLEPPRVKE